MNWMYEILSLKNRDGRATKFPFNQEVADRLCTKIQGGARLTFVCGLDGIPSYNVICRWRRECEDFNNQILDAYLERADHFQLKLLFSRYRRNGRYIRKSFRNDVKECKRNIGERYPERLKCKVDRRREKVIIDTGIHTIELSGRRQKVSPNSG